MKGKFISFMCMIVLPSIVARSHCSVPYILRSDTGKAEEPLRQRVAARIWTGGTTLIPVIGYAAAVAGAPLCAQVVASLWRQYGMPIELGECWDRVRELIR